MDAGTEIISCIKSIFPKLFVTEMTDNELKFDPEQDNGFIEYKRTLCSCTDTKAQQYATQMRWRITENTRHQCATYYIGVDDDGTIVGLANDEIMNCITKFVSIAKSINASISCIQIIHIGIHTIIRINVKIKKISDNYLVEFGEKY